MAWYYGTFSCGHEGRVNIIGPGKDRPYKIEKAFSKVCEDCFKERLEEKKKKDNAEADEVTEKLNLPKLIGTEKQVRWAKTLRIKFMQKAEKELNEALEEYKNEKKFSYDFYELLDSYHLTKFNKIDLLNDLLNTINYILKSKTESTYYIDKRFSSASHLVIEAYVEKNNIVEEKTLKENVFEQYHTELSELRSEYRTKKAENVDSEELKILKDKIKKIKSDIRRDTVIIGSFNSYKKKAVEEIYKVLIERLKVKDKVEFHLFYNEEEKFFIDENIEVDPDILKEEYEEEFKKRTGIITKIYYLGVFSFNSSDQENLKEKLKRIFFIEE